jgi:hypothetical protein
MAPPVFTNFLTETLTLAARVSVEGAVGLLPGTRLALGAPARRPRQIAPLVGLGLAYVVALKGQVVINRSRHLGSLRKAPFSDTRCDCQQAARRVASLMQS